MQFQIEQSFPPQQYLPVSPIFRIGSLPLLIVGSSKGIIGYENSRFLIQSDFYPLLKGETVFLSFCISLSFKQLLRRGISLFIYLLFSIDVRSISVTLLESLFYCYASFYQNFFLSSSLSYYNAFILRRKLSSFYFSLFFKIELISFLNPESSIFGGTIATSFVCSIFFYSYYFSYLRVSNFVQRSFNKISKELTFC